VGGRHVKLHSCSVVHEGSIAFWRPGSDSLV
jgi:hypothetical protein